MSQIDCNACHELKQAAPNFVQNGIGDTECASLAADTGLNPSLNPKHNDATDLHDMNDCMIGSAVNDLEKHEICDWQDFMEMFIGNLYEMFKGIICALGGIWTYIHNLLTRVGNLETRMTNLEGRVSALETWKTTIDNWKSGIDSWKTSISNTVAGHTTTINNHTNTLTNHGNRISALEGQATSQAASITAINRRIDEIIEAMGGDEDEIPVMKRYRYTVPAEAFDPIWKTTVGKVMVNNSWSTAIPSDTGIVEWFAGGGNNEDVGEMWIRVPVTEMDSITGVWTQTWVVPSGNAFDGRGKSYVQTVNVQEWYEQGGYLIINFDTYIIAPQRLTAEESPTNPQNGGPYPITIDFLVVGKKRITT